MIFHVDRDLPVPLRAQLQGLIEYGIACGELRAGEALPSVRELAETIGVAPMTVTQVYRELKGAGLIETRPGAGTYVADSLPARTAGRPEVMHLRQKIDALIDEGLALGVRTSDLASLVNARLFYRASLGQRTSVVMVGLFQAATVAYARDIAARLGNEATVAPMTLSALQRDPAAKARAASADLVVTFANRHRELESLLPNTKVVAISFIPAEDTRRALASLDPLARVGVVSRFAEFLPIMKSGVQRFAPHVGSISAANLDTPGIEAILAGSDVIVFATGAEAVLAEVRAETPTIEYRHAPDPVDIDRIIRPAIRAAEPVAEPEERQAS